MKIQEVSDTEYFSDGDTPKKRKKLKKANVPLRRRSCPTVQCSFGLVLFMLFLVIVTVVSVITNKISKMAAIHIFQEIIDNSREAKLLVIQHDGLVTLITTFFINIVLILFFNFVYSYFAVWLTNWEYCRTQSEYSQSIKHKILTLKFVNFSTAIVYLLFFKGRFDGRLVEYNTIFEVNQEQTSSLDQIQQIIFWM